MLKHTLSIPHEETLRQVLCLHTSLPAHELAFRINKKMRIKLKRDKEDLDARNNTEQYPVFSYCCPKEKREWKLIGNKIHTTHFLEGDGALFGATEGVRFLFNSLSSVDFLLDSGILDANDIQSKLQRDPMIQSCYPLPKNLTYIQKQLRF